MKSKREQSAKRAARTGPFLLINICLVLAGLIGCNQGFRALSKDPGPVSLNPLPLSPSQKAQAFLLAQSLADWSGLVQSYWPQNLTPQNLAPQPAQLEAPAQHQPPLQQLPGQTTPHNSTGSLEAMKALIAGAHCDIRSSGALAEPAAPTALPPTATSPQPAPPNSTQPAPPIELPGGFALPPQVSIFVDGEKCPIRMSYEIRWPSDGRREKIKIIWSFDVQGEEFQKLSALQSARMVGAYYRDQAQDKAVRFRYEWFAVSGSLTDIDQRTITFLARRSHAAGALPDPKAPVTHSYEVSWRIGMDSVLAIFSRRERTNQPTRWLLNKEDLPEEQYMAAVGRLAIPAVIPSALAELPPTPFPTQPPVTPPTAPPAGPPTSPPVAPPATPPTPPPATQPAPPAAPSAITISGR